MKPMLKQWWLVMAFAAACSTAEPPTSTPPPGPPPPPPPPPAGATVATITVSPSSVVIAIGSDRALTAEAKDAAGNPVTATFTWQTTNASVATVDAAGKVTAVAEGAADITASSGSVRSSPVAVAVTDNAQWPASGTSASSLIGAAVKQGTLTPEQGLVYRVFAAFSDARLPAPYRGPADNTPDNSVLIEAADRFASVSVATQAQLAPFFVPSPYLGSWYQARFPLAAPAAGPAGAAAAPCIFSSGHRTLETTHFKIHYDGNSTWGVQLDQIVGQSAALAAAEAENVWQKETVVFGRQFLSDGTVTAECNGGDGKLDIYIENPLMFAITNPAGVQAKVVPYLGFAPCAKTPSKIHLTGDGDAKALRNALAHEFFHVLELGSYNRAANCFAEYYWLGEATGNWAMDFVYGNPKDQVEQPYAAGYMFAERLVPLDEAYGGDRDKTNGYCDYVFLLYLARKYSDTVLKQIWDASESANSVAAIVNALASHGGIKKIWPAFALALWNDVGAANQDDFNGWDQLDWGMKKAFDLKDAGGRFGSPSLKVDQQGAPRESFELLTSSAVFPQDHELPRLTVHADYLKFTDSNVASVLYTNGLALADFPNLKIQAMVKTGGVWKAAEDWTKEGAKSFCRDLKAERVQELVLIYSNSDGDKTGRPIPFLFLPRVSVSNVGCAKWEGTASVKVDAPGFPGGSSLASVSNLVFERQRFTQLPDGAPGMEIFTNTSGAITGSATALCVTQSTQGTASPLDASLEIHLDNLVVGTLGPPPDRHVVQGIGASMLSTNTLHCSLGTIIGDQVWSWLEIPVPGHAVKADGRTIEGNVVEVGPFATKTLKWKLTAVREP